MSRIERRRSETRVRGRERELEVQVGALGGFELRPTRVFVWAGEERGAGQRILSLGSPPRSLMIPRRERELLAGNLRVRSLGNPLMTIALAGIHAIRAARRPTS
jgi:hypothetical protein